MKKLTAIFLCFAMALSLAACGNTTSSTNESSTPESSVPPASSEASDTSSTAASQEPAFQEETEVEAGNTLVVQILPAATCLNWNLLILIRTKI